MWPQKSNLSFRNLRNFSVSYSLDWPQAHHPPASTSSVPPASLPCPTLFFLIIWGIILQFLTSKTEHVQANNMKQKVSKNTIGFVLAIYCWSWGPFLSVVNVPSDSPLKTSKFSFARRSQLETDSWLGVGIHVHFPTSKLGPQSQALEILSDLFCSMNPKHTVQWMQSCWMDMFLRHIIEPLPPADP